ncbi:MAG TPA: M28 family peptidase [Bryobacteraceae bacterium]|nr:M28 family peptidase [Bryobacteraceae bacterium]
MYRAVVALLVAVPAFSQAPIRGFPSDQWKPEHDREQQLQAMPSPERIRIYMERIAARPHYAGSAGDKAVAEYAAGLMKEWGLDAHIEMFEPLLPYPTARSLEMVAPVRYRAELREPAIAGDDFTAETGQLPTFNAYSASGDVTAPLVYANFGTPADYDYLRQQGVEIKGKIVIARYGRIWRGAKVELAAQNGAVACLLYSDPHEDGYFQNDVYPKGPMRPAMGVQRGSILAMTIYPGDPLTPGRPSISDQPRLDRADAVTLPKIPAMPLSYGDAKPLLAQLGGPVAPEAWRGALPVTYHLGPGPATVHLKLDFDWTNKPARDVIATIPGSVYKDQWILFGNHHDAWATGASDPVSGASALLETARVLAALRKQGWQPKRTIILALWDAEEFGLVGSTEWVEKHEDELEREAAVYINSDTNGRGSFGAGGSATLETFLREILREIPDPETSRPLVESRGEFHLSSLGAGSDYVAFLDHAGIASLNVGFGGADSGVYHSNYDTVDWYRRFSDGDFTYERALSQLTSTAMLRLADAPVLPFDFRTLVHNIHRYLEEIQNSAADFRDVHLQLARLHLAAKAYEQVLSLAMKHPVDAERLRRVNVLLARAEGALLLPDGLPRREWYRHQIYAPGRYTGYAPKTLPAVREAMEAHNWDEANEQARRLATALKAMADQVEQAAQALRE